MKFKIEILFLVIIPLFNYCHENENWKESQETRKELTFKSCEKLKSEQINTYYKKSKSTIKIKDNQNIELIVSSLYNTEGKEKEFINLEIGKKQIQIYGIEPWNYPGQITTIYFECPFVFYHTICFKWTGSIGYLRNRINIQTGKIENDGLCN